MPVKPLHFLVLVFVLTFVVVLLQLQVIGLVLDKLGLSPQSATTLLFASLFGSMINLPLFTLRGDPAAAAEAPPPPPGFLGQVRPYQGKTVIAINVGGAIIPVGFSLYLLVLKAPPLSDVLMVTAIVTALSFAVSQPIKGMGIGMPMLLAPLAAALAAVLVNPGFSAPLAYIGGTLGVLIGADLLHLKDIPKLATPVASIGGAGTFDGVFFTGLIAVLLT